MYSSAKKVGVARSQREERAQHEARPHEGGEKGCGAELGADECLSAREHPLGGAGRDGHALSIGASRASVSARRGGFARGRG